MDRTNSPLTSRATAHHGGLRRTEVVILLTAPVLLLLGRLLLVPFDDQKWGDMLTAMADKPTQNAIGWTLALVAVALLAVGGLGLVRLVADRPLLAVLATVGVAFGWAGATSASSLIGRCWRSSRRWASHSAGPARRQLPAAGWCWATWQRALSARP